MPHLQLALFFASAKAILVTSGGGGLSQAFDLGLLFRELLLARLIGTSRFLLRIMHRDKVVAGAVFLLAYWALGWLRGHLRRRKVKAFDRLPGLFD